MGDAERSAVAEFDLGPLNVQRDSLKRFAFGICVIIAATAVLLSAYLAVRNLPGLVSGQRSGAEALLDYVAWGVSAAMLVVALDNILDDGAAAETLRLSERGLELRFRDGRLLRQRWSDPWLRLRVYEWYDGSPRHFLNLRVGRIYSVIPPEASQYMIELASRHGLRVEVSRPFVGTIGVRPKLTAIQGGVDPASRRGAAP
jgi:hypothetical protein